MFLCVVIFFRDTSTEFLHALVSSPTCLSQSWSVICCQEWGCTWLLVEKLGHTGLVLFVDELGTVCWEVPLKYGFEVLVGMIFPLVFQ